MKIQSLQRRQVFPVRQEELFAFFRQPENLGSITPTWLDFKIITPLPIEMQAGTEIEYTISWLGIPLRWKTLIEEFSPPHRFVDTQVRGPYSYWRHTHFFAEVKGGTEMTDQVRYALPLGPLGEFAHTLAIRKQVERIFDHRAEVLAKKFGDYTQPVGLLD